MSVRSLFVTGTDTGVGKTLVAAALIALLTQRGQKVVGMKPIASGSTLTDAGAHHGHADSQEPGANAQGLRNQDALALMAQANVAAPYALVNPYCFEPAIAPHIAAAEAGVRIELAVLQHAHAQLGQHAEQIVIEGAGGWLTPLSERETLADFAGAVGAEAILVVGLRLGCINHALLTAQAIAAAGLKLTGWVANTLQPDMPRCTQNIQTLKERLAPPLLGVIPYRRDATPAEVAGFLSLPS